MDITIERLLGCKDVHYHSYKINGSEHTNSKAKTITDKNGLSNCTIGIKNFNVFIDRIHSNFIAHSLSSFFENEDKSCYTEGLLLCDDLNLGDYMISYTRNDNKHSMSDSEKMTIARVLVLILLDIGFIKKDIPINNRYYTTKSARKI